MAKVEDCPGFETFGADVKAARKARRLARKALAEMVGIEYFNPEVLRSESEQRQRVGHKLKLCPEEYLPIIEGAIDGAIKIEQPKKKETGDA